MPQICPPDHKHEATHTCYSHGCRCDPCRSAHARTARERRKLMAYGRFDHGFVAGEPVRDHIRFLRANGLGVKTISKLSGIHAATLGAIMWGRNGNPPCNRVRRENAAAIFAVKPSLDLLAAGAMIDPLPTRRRIQALACLGWTWRAIAQEADIDERRVWWFLEGQLITAGNARLIRDVYSRLWDRIPTSDNPHVVAKIRSARAKAKRFGWTPPFGWDDIDTDEEPADQGKDRGRSWVIDELEHLRLLGESPDSAAAILAEKPSTMSALAYRHGRADIARWIDQANREAS